MKFFSKMGTGLTLMICMLFSGIGHGEDLEYFKHNKLGTADFTEILVSLHDNWIQDAYTTKMSAANGYGTIWDPEICTISPTDLTWVHDHLLPANNLVLIDIGSGAGGCSKTASFLGCEFIPMN